MKLRVSSFKRAASASSQTHANIEVPFNSERRLFEAETPEFQISDETPMRVRISCTQQWYYGIVVIQNGANIINLAGMLGNYASAMILLSSGFFLEIHVEKNPAVNQ